MGEAPEQVKAEYVNDEVNILLDQMNNKLTLLG